MYQVEQEKHYIIVGGGYRLAGDFKMSRLLVLEPIGEDAAHLIVRVRMKAIPEWSK